MFLQNNQRKLQPLSLPLRLWAAVVCIGVGLGLGPTGALLVSSLSFRAGVAKYAPTNLLVSDQHNRHRSRLWAEPSPVAALEQKGGLADGLAQERLQPHFSFPLDSWQVEAGGEILAGRNVIVCAPTGAGKTVVGEMALRIAFDDGMNAIYTTPLKALSNQKFMDLRKMFGPENVGLATGDMSINRGARIMVMTTEVYRNMAWRAASGSSDPESEKQESFDDLSSNAVVVLDEFHYMGQPGRGGVWEESIITSPPHTQIVGLSATLPNADRLAQWISSVTGRQTTLVEAGGGRPVPLRYLFATKDGLNHIFRDPDAGPGAPKGLLGLRGDGIPPLKAKQKNKKRKKGFSGEDDESEREGGFPKGLQINPILVNAMEKRMRYVDRKIQRRALRDEFNGRSDTPRISAREERRQRERLLRAEMRRAVPSLSFLVKRLEQKKLLPAIVFIFSRAGCDEAAETVARFMRAQGQTPSKGDAEGIEPGDHKGTNEGRKRKRKSRQRGARRGRESDEDWYSGMGTKSLAKDPSGRSFRLNSNYVTDETMASILDGPTRNGDRDDSNDGTTSPTLEDIDKFSEYAEYGLLHLSEVEDVASRVSAFNRDNPEIAFSDAVAERFLFGVGSHHAGMLAAHKAFVETLFKAQLMKVVFATETLAAGINMPARTTVVCALAKRGDNSAMNLLETSNLLQMAGRAGRRGMDTDGTCVIAATPFEGATEAQSILTSEIKPIVSQFTPSYSLAVNLVARGQGQLDVAQGLVRKSYAMWERQQREESVADAKDRYGDEMSEVLEAVAHERFLDTLKGSLQILQEKGIGPSKRSKAKFSAVIDLLTNRKLLKKESKSYLGLAQMLSLEQNTLKYLERESEAMDTASGDANDILAGLFSEDAEHMQSEMEMQRKRLMKSERDVNVHIFTAMAEIANNVLSGSGPEAEVLRAALSEARQTDPKSPISADELTTFAKSATVVSRKKRKMKSKTEGSDTQGLLDSLNDIDTHADKDDTWEDMVALINVLEAYGCIVPVDETIFNPEEQTYELTAAGDNIGIMGFDNSIWCLTAMGGAWDVANESAELDEFKSAMKDFDSYEETEDEDEFLPSTRYGPNEEEGTIPKPQQETETLVSLLRSLSASELAGYVSCLVSEGSRGGSSSVVESFMKLSPAQQPVIQSSLLALERLVEVQKKFSVDEYSSRCQLELASCDVVTAWAAGCSWSEAIEMSGAAPGDLARTLHRALDALRQFGNLSYNPVRATGATVQDRSSGIHPDIRRLCREAARAMDRYPVKDPLPFDEDEDDIEVVYTEDIDDDNVEEEKATDVLVSTLSTEEDMSRRAARYNCILMPESASTNAERL